MRKPAHLAGHRTSVAEQLRQEEEQAREYQRLVDQMDVFSWLFHWLCNPNKRERFKAKFCRQAA